jgi:DNA ligase-1
MKFNQLSFYFQKIETTTSRLEITRLLAELFQKLSADKIKTTLYLLQGRVAPLYEKIEFGIAEKMIVKGVLLSLNLEKKFFLDRYKKIGDLGQTIESFKKEIRSFEEKDLTIKEVYLTLLNLAKQSGEGSQERKIFYLINLFRQLDPLSCRYITRIITGTLRLGFSDMTVLDAFSWMIKGDKSLRGEIEKAYHVRPDLGEIGRLLKESGIDGLKKITPKIGTPILMMRAERLSSAKEIIEKIGHCAVEPKYDGFRLQIHFDKKKDFVRLFSRNLEDVTFVYPDIVDGVKKQVKANEIVFEGEAVGFNPQIGDFLPFQETVQRKRKYGIEEKLKEIPLKLFVFDILYVDGDNLLEKPFNQRRQALIKAIRKSGNLFSDVVITSPDVVIGEEERLENYFDEQIGKGLEGVIAKKLDGIYQPGARGWNWIKYKRSYSSKIEDTIDCLVMGYDLGKGKRTDFGIGAFLVGVYDKRRDKFLTVAKIGTGLSDEEWRQLKKECDQFKVNDKPNQYDVDKMMNVDIWVLPAIVVEIRADEITRSPVHTAARRLKPSKSGQALEVDIAGLALRFPRLERFRKDKSPSDVTTLDELEKMYRAQKSK